MITVLLVTLGMISISASTYEGEAIRIIHVDSYYDVPFGNLPENTVYIYPNSTIPDDVLSSNKQPLICADNYARDYNIPTSTWNVATQGMYEFAGSAASSRYTLYSLYKFSGKTTYTVSVTNLLSSSQAVNCHRTISDAIFSTFSVDGNSTATFSVSSGAAVWYLGFPGKCSVEGYVE